MKQNLDVYNSPFERSQMSLDQNSDMILFHTHLFSREVPRF